MMIFAASCWLIFAAVVATQMGPLALWPSLLLFAGLGLAHRLAPRVRFELKGLLGRLWPMTLVVPSAMGLLMDWLNGPSARVGGAIGSLISEAHLVALFTLTFMAAPLHASVIASEFTDLTAPTWLAQPRPLWKLLFEKWALAAGLCVAALAQVLTVFPSSGPDWMLGPALGTVLGGLSLLCALIFKETLAAAFVMLVASALPAAVALGLGLEEPPAAWAVPFIVLHALVSLGALLFVLRRPRAALLLQIREPRALAFSAGRGSALRALVLKELRLQAPAFGLMLGVVLLWAISNQETRAPLTLFGGLMVATLASITGILSEKAHGTFLPELALLPVRTAWRAKSLVAGAVAAAGGFALPLGLLRLRDANALDGLAGPWALVVAVTVSLGLVSSVYFKDLKTAFVAVLASGSCLLVASMVLTLAGSWAVQYLAAPLAPRWSLHAEPVVPLVVLPPFLHGHELLSALLHTALVSLPLLITALVLFASARRGFVGGSFRPRREVLTLAAVSSSPFVVGALDWLRTMAS